MWTERNPQGVGVKYYYLFSPPPYFLSSSDTCFPCCLSLGCVELMFCVLPSPVRMPPAWPQPAAWQSCAPFCPTTSSALFSTSTYWVGEAVYRIATDPESREDSFSAIDSLFCIFLCFSLLMALNSCTLVHREHRLSVGVAQTFFSGCVIWWPDKSTSMAE